MKKSPIYKGIFIIVGPPGTGKTTFLAKQVGEICDRYGVTHDETSGDGNPGWSPVVVCSLTRTAATEIAGRDLPVAQYAVGTLHAHAYRSLDAPDLADAVIDEFNDEHPIYRMGTGGKPSTDDPGWDRRRESDQDAPGDGVRESYDLLRSRMISRDHWPPKVTAFADAWEDWKIERNVIDFTDMIDQALLTVGQAPGAPEILIADEAQDLSALELSLLRKWGKRAGALIIAGDPYQSLYTWRGADPGIFWGEDVPADHRRVLSQSYRVPGAVHAVAMNWISQLSQYHAVEYRPRRDQETGEPVVGRVRTCSATWRRPDKAVNLAEMYMAEGRSVMFVASCSFLVGPTVAVLRKRGIPFANPWRVRRGDWNPLAASGTTMSQRILSLLQADGKEGRGGWWTARELWEWSDVLKAKGLLVRGAKKHIMLRAAEAEAAAGGTAEAPPVTSEDLLAWFNRDELGKLMAGIFERNDEWNAGKEPTGSLNESLEWWYGHVLTSRKAAAKYPVQVARKRGVAALRSSPTCFVGTVHSFKGAEADVVFLYPDISPAGYKEWSHRGESRDSVIRTFYVGMTRARDELVLCGRASTRSINIRPFIGKGD